MSNRTEALRHLVRESSVDPGRFRAACGMFATGVGVITAAGPNGRPIGITVNSFASVSLAPPLVLVCIDSRSSALAWFTRCRVFAINVLSRHQTVHSATFSGSGRQDSPSEWWSGPYSETPMLEGALATLVCDLRRLFREGDHDILIGHVQSIQEMPGEPLIYFHGEYRSLVSTEVQQRQESRV